MNVSLLFSSFFRGIVMLLGEVRRAPTWLVAMMLSIVILGTLLAQLTR